MVLTAANLLLYMGIKGITALEVNKTSTFWDVDLLTTLTPDFCSPRMSPFTPTLLFDTHPIHWSPMSFKNYPTTKKIILNSTPATSAIPILAWSQREKPPKDGRKSLASIPGDPTRSLLSNLQGERWTGSGLKVVEVLSRRDDVTLSFHLRWWSSWKKMCKWCWFSW